MKRVAAILGPTPSFVRWAIRLDCPFRQNNTDDLPYQTFRQLRNLRELSIGLLEQRVVDGICVHDEFNDDPQSARGFPVREVFACFGEEHQLRTSCSQCPANVIRHFQSNQQLGPDCWAGCYGWFRSTTDQLDWIERFQMAAQHAGPTNGFPESRRVWYQIWQINSWHSQRLKQLATFFDRLNSNLDSACSEFSDLRRAVDACLANRLVLETELIPRGNSDGVQWTIEPHCSICRCEMNISDRKCNECGHAGHPNRATKKKVLGLRPYMLLKDLIGLEETATLLANFKRTGRFE